MNLSQRIEILSKIGHYINDNNVDLQEAKRIAYAQNSWFTEEFTDLALTNLSKFLLGQDLLESFAKQYGLENEKKTPKTVGLVMAGNIPAVGFHDLLCIFLSGHNVRVKLSSKDPVLIKNLIDQVSCIYPKLDSYIQFEDMLKGCDAYIATGSDNSARYFEQYFQKFPHIIRKNRTSIAVLSGDETADELELLADDIQLYFGLGCRNVTQIYVPRDYDFVPLLNALRKYDFFKDHAKYRHNFDYYLTIAIMNNQFYMTNDSIVLIENKSAFSPIGQLNYQFYDDKSELEKIINPEKIQCMVGKDYTPFGCAQMPTLQDFADGVDTMTFLSSI